MCIGRSVVAACAATRCSFGCSCATGASISASTRRSGIATIAPRACYGRAICVVRAFATHACSLLACAGRAIACTYHTASRSSGRCTTTHLAALSFSISSYVLSATACTYGSTRSRARLIGSQSAAIGACRSRCTINARCTVGVSIVRIVATTYIAWIEMVGMMPMRIVMRMPSIIWIIPIIVVPTPIRVIPYWAIAPIPPQTIGIRREGIRIITIGINIPIPRAHAIYNIPIKGATNANSIEWIAETNQANGIFVIIFCTIKSIHPFAIKLGHLALVDV